MTTKYAKGAKRECRLGHIIGETTNETNYTNGKDSFREIRVIRSWFFSDEGASLVGGNDLFLNCHVQKVSGP